MANAAFFTIAYFIRSVFFGGMLVPKIEWITVLRFCQFPQQPLFVFSCLFNALIKFVNSRMLYLRFFKNYFFMMRYMSAMSLWR